MARTTRGRNGFRLARRVLSPLRHGVGLASNLGKSVFRRGKQGFNAVAGLADNAVKSTGNRVNYTFSELMGKRSTRRKTRRNRKSRSQRR